MEKMKKLQNAGISYRTLYWHSLPYPFTELFSISSRAFFGQKKIVYINNKRMKYIVAYTYKISMINLYLPLAVR